MTATRNNAGIAHDNGAIEALRCPPHRAAHGVAPGQLRPYGLLKQAIADAILMRGTADFPDLVAYRGFVDSIIGRHNARNKTHIDSERTTLHGKTLQE